MRNIIFYFTGTGNSYFVAKSIAEKMGNTQVAPLLKASEFEIEKYRTIGFVFPVYYIHAPEIVLRKVMAIPFTANQNVFVIATSGGSWGYALEDVRSVIADDINLQEYYVKMPGNYILEYGALTKFLQKQIFKKAEKQIDYIARAIQNSTYRIYVKPNIIAKLAKNIADKKIKSFPELGEAFFATSNCTLCMQCVQLCPVDNITRKGERLVWQDKCIQCMSCIQWCPQNAISHPLMKNGRKRYTHPNVSAKQVKFQNAKDNGGYNS